MEILRPTDFNVEIISQSIVAIAEGAIQWFDIARKVDALANTQFIFVLTRYVDRREENEVADRRAACIVKWYKQETPTFCVSRGGGPAFDTMVEATGDRSFFEQDPRFPTGSTASLSVAQIVNVNDITSEVLSKLREPAPQLIEKIELEVTLLGLDEECLDREKWVLRW